WYLDRAGSDGIQIQRGRLRAFVVKIVLSTPKRLAQRLQVAEAPTPRALHNLLSFGNQVVEPKRLDERLRPAEPQLALLALDCCRARPSSIPLSRPVRLTHSSMSRVVNAL